MKIDLIGCKKTWEAKRILKELKKRKIHHGYVDPREISYIIEGDKIKLYNKNKPYKIPNVVFCRSGFTTTYIEEEGSLFLRILGLLDVKIVDPIHTVLGLKGKIISEAIFAKKNLPHAKTFYLKSEKLRKKLSFSPIVMKPYNGSQGRGIKKLGKIKSLPKEDVFFQELFPTKPKDTRVLVLGNKVIGAIVRQAKEGEWRSNVALGATTRPVKIDKKMEKLALDAAKSHNISFAGIDILTDDEGNSCVIEANRAPQFRGFMKATKIDVPKKIVDYLLSLK
jgi:RimK family alpha-L-glutamate ligase